MNNSLYAVRLPWDSQLLGFSVARLTGAGLTNRQLTKALATARQQGIRLVYLVLGPSDGELASTAAAHGRLADRKLTFVQAVPAASPTQAAPDEAIGPATVLTPALESLAWQSGEFSRFRLEPRFAPIVFQQLYSQWICNSLDGSIARSVLVFRDINDIERGLITLGEKNGRADIGLLGVDAALRGQRVGQRLMAAAVAQARAWGYPEMQVVTQGSNELACRFYEKCGFRLAQQEHIYHVWLD